MSGIFVVAFIRCEQRWPGDEIWAVFATLLFGRYDARSTSAYRYPTWKLLLLR